MDEQEQKQEQSTEQETVDTLVAKLEETRTTMQAQIDKLNETIAERNATIKRIINQQPVNDDDDMLEDEIIKKLKYLRR